MLVALSYGAPSGVEMSGAKARVRLSGARERGGVRWRGAVKEPIAVREALLALHDVVASDLRWRPPAAREEFHRWLQAWLDKHAAAERARVDAERRRALEWRFAEERAQAWVLLDPVVSVHPDQVQFEAFSRDGSTYARVGIDRSRVEEVGEVSLGTTNVDFSVGLYEAVRRLRSFWRTELALDPGGVEVATDGAATHKEKKIDLPDAWVRGFVQIGAAALLDAVRVELLPVHVHDVCRHLRLHKAKASPRALRWELTPGRPVEAVLEPWEHRLVLHGSRHASKEPRTIRTWGRARWRLVERTIPIAQRFELHLLGRGLPYFLTAHGPGVDVTFGLSGWTRADWTATARLDALIARRRLGGATSPRPLAWLEQHGRGTPEQVALAAGVSTGEATAALVEAAGRGLAVYDLLHGVWRHRPLVPGGLPAGIGLGEDPAASEGRRLAWSGAAVVTGSRREADGGTRVQGRVAEAPGRAFEPEVVLSDEGSVKAAACGCFAAKQGLKAGLCLHQHALLLVYE